MKSKIIFEWIFWVLLSVLMFSIGMGIALIAPAVVLIAPASFMVLEKRQGFREALLGVLFGAIIVFVMSGPVSAFMYAVAFGLLGVIFGIIEDKSENGIDYIAMAIMASIVAKIILMVTFTKFSGVNPFTMTPGAANELITTITDVLSKSGIQPSEEAIKSYSAAMIDTVSLLMPSMLILFSTIDTFATYGIVSLILKKLGSRNLVVLPPFGEWRFPKNIFWALLVSVIMDFASKSLPDQRVFVVLSANLMEVLRAIFMIEGLSLCWYYMTSKGIHRAVKIGFSIFCVIFLPISYILSMVGIFDIWYDLRSRIRGK